jgi:hypothetical protein
MNHVQRYSEAYADKLEQEQYPRESWDGTWVSPQESDKVRLLRELVELIAANVKD